jgi:hypothetical protein
MLAVAANCWTVWLVLLMQECCLMDEQLVLQVDMTRGFEWHAFSEIAGCECHHEVNPVSRSAACSPDYCTDCEDDRLTQHCQQRVNPFAYYLF